MLYIENTLIEAASSGDDFPEMLDDPITGEPAFRVSYVRTDAWRGYHETSPLDGSGWMKVDGGWVTGDWPDAPAEAQESNVKAKLDALAEDQDVVVVFAPTSNVFSTVYDVYVHGEAEEEDDGDEKEPTYKIVRFFQNRAPKDTIKTGLTLEEAQAHCQDPETSSSTATSEAAREYTEEHGPWFDGYDEE